MHAMRSDANAARYLYEEPLSPDETRSLLEQKKDAPSWAPEGDWLTVAVVERASGLTAGPADAQFAGQARQA
jgi:hypothetical protein